MTTSNSWGDIKEDNTIASDPIDFPSNEIRGRIKEPKIGRKRFGTGTEPIDWVTEVRNKPDVGSIRELRTGETEVGFFYMHNAMNGTTDYSGPTRVWFPFRQPLANTPAVIDIVLSSITKSDVSITYQVNMINKYGFVVEITAFTNTLPLIYLSGYYTITAP